MAIENLADAFYEELRDLFSAEKQLTKALPKMVKNASSEELRDAFENHLTETKDHVERVEKAFEDTGKTARAKTCEAMEGLIKEAEELLKEKGDPTVKDALMIAAAQKVEHYEIATYGTLCTWAESLGYDNALALLKQNMGDEEAADQKLSELAKTINQEALGAKKKLSPPIDRSPSDAAIHHSYWLRRQPLKKRYPRLSGNHTTQVLVLGGGVTGLSIALELLSRGKKVTVCEANTIGAGTTGGSSGHLDAHPEIGPSRLIKLLGVELATVYVRFRLDAIERIARCSDTSCEFNRTPAYYYTESESHLDTIRSEFEQAKRIGLNVTWDGSVPIAKALGGYKIAGMARLNCLAYLTHLAKLVHERGGTIFEQTMVTGLIEPHPTSLETSGGNIVFDQVVCAVHCNFTDSFRLFFQTPAYQSYAIAAKINPALPDALFWDDSQPYNYVRRATNDGHIILAGGKDHRTGDGNEAAAMENLEAWIRQRFSVEEILSRWSAELFEPTDGLPFIGKVAGKENVWMATGLSGVGLTLGTAAGPMIADLMEGKSHELQEVLSPGRMPVGSAAKVLAEQIPPTIDYAERVLPSHKVELDKLRPTDGDVGIVDGKLTAVCRDHTGCLHQLSPLCTHMGGVLRWNNIEQTWDCPVHGGRFAADGKRLYGPPEVDMGEQKQ